MILQAATETAQTNWTNLGAGFAVAFLLLKEVFNFVLKFSPSAKEKRNSNGTTGDKAPEYWQLEFRRAISETIGPVIEHQNHILDNMERLLNRQTEAWERQTQLMAEVKARTGRAS